MRYYECKKCGWNGEVSGRYRCLACNRRRVKEWRKNNKEKYRAQKSRGIKRFRETRRKEFNAKRRRKRNPERNSEMRKRRMEWLLSGSLTRLELIEIYERDNGQCVYCKQAVKARFS